ncbi:MAG: SIS domain-containing protein, partial [bacterium]|nr:SIS domain-containing protein [bacterium]
LLTFLSKLDIIKINNKDIFEIKSIISENNNKYGISTSKTTNLAKQFSQKIFNKIPVLIGGEFLIGAIHAIRNQMNENAKSLAIYFPLPELDHHLLEALTFPKNIQEYDHYIFFYSNLYSEKISKRSIITKDFVEQNGHKTSIFKPTGKSKLSQTIESIHFGSYMGYYLSLLYNIDPSPIHWVEEFKKKLG